MKEYEKKDEIKRLLTRLEESCCTLDETLASMRVYLRELEKVVNVSKVGSVTLKMDQKARRIRSALTMACLDLDALCNHEKVFEKHTALYKPQFASLAPYSWSELKGLKPPKAGRPRYQEDLLTIITEAVNSKKEATRILAALRNEIRQHASLKNRERNKKQFEAIARAFKYGFLGKDIPPYNVLADALPGLMPERSFYNKRKSLQ